MKAIIKCGVDNLVKLREKTYDLKIVFANYCSRAICLCESQGIFFIYIDGEELLFIKRLTNALQGEMFTEEDFIFRIMDNVSSGKIVNLDLKDYTGRSPEVLTFRVE